MSLLRRMALHSAGGNPLAGPVVCSYSGNLTTSYYMDGSTPMYVVTLLSSGIITLSR
jgi:hypothetical protein